MFSVEDPFFGRVLLWVPALCMAGQDPTGPVCFLHFLSQPFLPPEGRKVSVRGSVDAILKCTFGEMLQWNSVLRGYVQTFTLAAGFGHMSRAVTDPRPQIASALGHFLALPPSCLRFKWTFTGKRCWSCAKCHYWALLGLFLQACHCLWRNIYINFKMEVY